MYSSYFVSKHVVPILALVAIQVHICSGVSLNITNEYLNHKCYTTQGKYKSGSEYEKILKSTIRSIFDGNFGTGYIYPRKTDPGGNFASVLLQCRGDTYGSKCRSCFATALDALRRKCSSYKGGIIWYDQCFVEISAIDTIGKVDYDNIFCIPNSKNITGDDTFAFNSQYWKLSENLTKIAISKDNKVHGMRRQYATGMNRFEKEKIYGMIQCTEDMSHQACFECMNHNFLHFYECLRDKRGGRIFGRSCSFRYEFYPFTRDGLKYI